MKAMPFPFEEFQGKGVLDFCSSSSDSFSSLLLHQPTKWTREEDKEDCYLGFTEPTSVLDSRRSPNSSTMSSSLGSNSTCKGGGGGGGGSCHGSSHNNTNTNTNNPVIAAPNVSENQPQASSLGTSPEKCGGGGGGLRMVEDWEGQDQSIMRLIMGDVEDPSAGLSKLFQGSGVGGGGCGPQGVVDFNGGFGVLDQGLNMVSIIDPNSVPGPGNYHPGFPLVLPENNIDAKTGSESIMFSSSAPPGNNNNSNNPMIPGMFGSHQNQQVIGVMDEKPQLINPQFLINQNQVQFSENPSFFVPLTYPTMQEQQQQQVFASTAAAATAKRPLSDAVGHNFHQVPRLPLLECGQELFGRRQQTQLPLFPHHLQQQQQQQQHQQNQRSLVVPSAKQQKVNSTGDDSSLQLQQTIFDQLYNTAELIEAGNPVLAQGILARLNHQLSPIGKPFQRAAFYMKDALQLLLHSNISTNLSAFSPIGFIFKVRAYKSFSEVSPVLQFANFTTNQALIEAVDRFDRIHVIDFDIGFGVQWSSFMQELALRNSGAVSLKVTAVVATSTCDDIELNFTRESLSQYAKELNMSFELNVVSIESLNSQSCPLAGQFFDSEAIAVNMPLSSFANCTSLFPSILRFIKQLRPKVVVTLDRSCSRIDAPFSTNVVHALQCYSALLESLDAVNLNLDVLQVIERHFIQPAIKKIVMGHHHSQEKLPPWRNMFLQTGFLPYTFSNFTDVQAECLVQRAPARGFQVERRNSSLVLCWQRKELMSVSTWRC